MKVIRWKNLLIVVATMFMVRYFLLASVAGGMEVMDVSGVMVPVTLKMPWYDFLLLVIASVCLTAGGYVINDYFDIKTDIINRGNVIVGTVIPRRRALMFHNILNVIGVAAGFAVSARAGYFWLGTLFLIISGLLWFYSASYKRQFLIGNLLVALLTALIPVAVMFYEFPFMFSYYESNSIGHPGYRVLFLWTGGFALFAFMTTLAREIIKDIEDYEGDMEFGRNTLPVILGIRSSRIVVALLLASIIGSLYLAWVFILSDLLTLIYISVALAVPLLVVLCMVVTGKCKRRFHDASSLMKYTMLAGLIYTAIVKIILSKGLF